MLGKLAKNYSSMIATQLVEDGMLWGEELEWFIRKSLEGLVNLENNEKYYEIEAKILELVEKRRRRVKIRNVYTDEVLYFGTTIEASEKLDLKYHKVQDAIRKKTVVDNKYLVTYERLSIKELSA